MKQHMLLPVVTQQHVQPCGCEGASIGSWGRVVSTRENACATSTVSVRDRRTWLPLKGPFLRRVLNTCIGKWPFSRCRVRAPRRGRERSVSSVSGCHRAPTQSSVNMCSGPSPAGTVLETWAHRGLRGERRGCGGKRGIPLLVACFCYRYVE